MTLEESGQVHADVSAAGIAVSGTVKGSLVAERRIELRPTATVEGNIVAPTIRVEDGALVRGKMDIEGSRKSTLQRRRRRELREQVRGSNPNLDLEPRTPNLNLLTQIRPIRDRLPRLDDDVECNRLEAGLLDLDVVRTRLEITCWNTPSKSFTIPTKYPSANTCASRGAPEMRSPP